MSLDNFKEREFKYFADDIGLSKFQELMKTLNPKSVIEVSSWDFYYTNDKDEFIRYRKCDNRPELTIKRKTNNLNNQDRIEVNLPLQTDNEDLVDAFTNLLNYKRNFKVYKSCFIYFFDNVDIVYYIVYDEDMKERGRFIEIEYLEETFVESENPMDALKSYEQKLSVLGINPQNRLKKSLYEIFKKA